MIKLFFKLSLLSFLALAVLFMVDFKYRDIFHLEYRVPKHLLPNPPIAQKYQLVKLGNSHAQAGITFKGFKSIRTLDLSGVAQRFEVDLALLRQHAAEIDEGAVIIINVSPISFSHTAANSLKGFQAGYYGRVSPFLIPHINPWDFLESEFFPFVRAGYFWRKKNTEQISERISKEEKWVEAETPATLPNQPETPGQAAPEVILPNFLEVSTIQKELQTPTDNIPGQHKNNMNFIFNKWYHTDEFNPEFFPINRRDLEEIIALSLRRKWRPVLITIPVSDELQDGLLDDYMQLYLYDNLKKTHTRGLEYFDFSSDTSITKNNSLFSNADHLNDKGASIFSHLLMKKFIDHGYLKPDVDSYIYPLPAKVAK